MSFSNSSVPSMPTSGGCNSLPIGSVRQQKVLRALATATQRHLASLFRRSTACHSLVSVCTGVVLCASAASAVAGIGSAQKMALADEVIVHCDGSTEASTLQQAISDSTNSSNGNPLTQGQLQLKSCFKDSDAKTDGDSEGVSDDNSRASLFSSSQAVAGTVTAARERSDSSGDDRISVAGSSNSNSTSTVSSETTGSSNGFDHDSDHQNGSHHDNDHHGSSHHSERDEHHQESHSRGHRDHDRD